MSGLSRCSSAKSPEKVCVFLCGRCRGRQHVTTNNRARRVRWEDGEEKKKDQGIWQPETQRVEHQGCQRQGGPLALNGSLVRKVEGEEVQIKDVPSLRRKSSHPSLLNGRLKLRKLGSKGGRSVEGGSAIQPGCHIGGGAGMLQHGVQETHAKQANTSTHES